MRGLEARATSYLRLPLRFGLLLTFLLSACATPGTDQNSPPITALGLTLARSCNHLRFRLGPGEVAIAIGAQAKAPGQAQVGELIELEVTRVPDDEAGAYQRLLDDALVGDAELFAREDSVEQAWRIVAPSLDRATPIHRYAPGSWGPDEAQRLTAAHGGWHDPS